MNSSDPAESWGGMSWRGEPAWTSVCGGVRAIVSEACCRLVYLGEPDGSRNLLHAPGSPSDKEDPHPNHGGHRFWLGPQYLWVWPPPAEWEYMPAVSAAVEHEALILRHARLDPAYPALTREYAWEGRRLRCTVRWSGGDSPYFGLHVVAVDAPLSINTRLESSEAAPDGLVFARMVEEVAPLRLPHPAISMKVGYATVRAGTCEAKLGFVPQPLTIRRPGGWSLSMHPGPCSGEVGKMSDHGYLSQVWVGDAAAVFAEIEQLTPLLQGDRSGCCSSTIYLDAGH